MLVIGRALMTLPKLLLLDEPSLGLSPLLTKEIFRTIEKINVEDNTSILIVEQNALAGLSISAYGYVMENGQIVIQGTPEKLRDNELVREFYLGYSSSGEKISYRDIRHSKRRIWIG